MSEKTKEEQLKEKLIEFFDKRLSDLNTKFTSDIEKIESYKFEYFDTVIKIYREIQDEQKKQEEHEKQEKEKEKEEKKEKPEKKSEEPKHDKATKKKPATNTNRERPKTPLGTNKAKGKGDKEKEKEKQHDTTDKHDKKKLTITTVGGGNTKPAKGRLNTEANKRPITGKSDAKSKPQLGKKPAANSKKVDPKKAKGKKDAKPAKAEHKEEPKEEPKEEAPKVEEKKPVIINPKYIINIPDELKNNNNLCSVYFILKKNYLDKKNVLLISASNPLLYKCFGNNMKFLLDEKKNDIDKKAKEIESFLNNYGDLNTYLTKEFSLSKKAMSSLSMLKKEEIPKNDNLPSEMGGVLKYLYYLLDENLDEKLSTKELLDNFLRNILEKIEDKTFKSLLVNYFQKNKFLNLTQEKAENINKIVNENNSILNMVVMGKNCRPFNLLSFLLKEVHDYINLKTSDGHYYYELRQKNQQLQKYQDFIYLYDNNGKERNQPKEEKKEEKPKEENNEKPEEQTKIEENKTEEKPAEEKVEKTEEETKKEEKPQEEKNEEQKNEEVKPEDVKPEENKIEEESVKKEESTEQQSEQPKQE